ncbi:MAG: hypothetical protein WKF89_01220 [Chitinophagaceae bacterium]
MDSLDYIDSYFKGALSTEQRVIFEDRIKSDGSFADEVAFYLTALQAARNQNATDKKERFREIYGESKKVQATPARLSWLYQVAAAAIITVLIVGVYLYLQPDKPQNIAKHYINKHFNTMGVQMGTLTVNMENGKRLYNEGKFEQALQTFEELRKIDSTEFFASEFAGITALQLKNYDKAASYFEQMERHTAMYVNPGRFYHALTLMKRNKPGDQELAASLLKDVVKRKLSGKDEAQRFLNIF